MKKILIITIMLLTIQSYSQVSTISYDSSNTETLSFYNERAILIVDISELYLTLSIDLDGNNGDYNGLVLKYKFISEPKLVYNKQNKLYSIELNFEQKNNCPLSGYIELSNRMIKLYYSDNSTLIYIGEGVIINL